MLRRWIENSASEDIAEHWHRWSFLEDIRHPEEFEEEEGELLSL